ncbi:MAG: hypothetical protein PHH31_07930, partial [Acidaminococcaceae bacterium]|nr:hypothetical protein [Acidaminococcaceae bacterium]
MRNTNIRKIEVSGKNAMALYLILKDAYPMPQWEEIAKAVKGTLFTRIRKSDDFAIGVRRKGIRNKDLIIFT